MSHFLAKKIVKKTFFITLITHLSWHMANGRDNFNSNPELDVPIIVAATDYPLETHFVTTEDGYILRMHRIPHGLNNSQQEIKPAVYLQHGLMMSSADWVLMGPENGLGYLMADLGYDVWMGNTRGNRYSRNHTWKNPDSSLFWEFSWNEVGVYDLPAMIDHILNVTNRKTVTYIGHSQGTTVSYVMGSERPEYNRKVNVIVSFAPVCYLYNLPNIGLRAIGVATLRPLIEAIEVNPSSKAFQSFLNTSCSDSSPLQILCEAFIYYLSGYESTQLNKTALPLIMQEVLSGGSSNEFIHYGQNQVSANFQKYDFGVVDNLKKYTSIRPPKYNLSKITAPVVLYYGDNDKLVAPASVQRLYKELANGILKKQVPYNGFTHLDFLFGIDVKKLLYDDLFNLLDNFKSAK